MRLSEIYMWCIWQGWCPHQEAHGKPLGLNLNARLAGNEASGSLYICLLAVIPACADILLVQHHAHEADEAMTQANRKWWWRQKSR